MQTAPVPTSRLDPRICDQARLTRDARFDGLFYIAVTSTGIYCRPVCPAPSPRVKNIRYYDSAAAASAAGFRPCLRCRPEAAPGSPLHHAKSDLVAGALRLIEQGALDEGSLPELAARVGVGERHLRADVGHLVEQEREADLGLRDPEPRQVHVDHRLAELGQAGPGRLDPVTVGDVQEVDAWHGIRLTRSHPCRQR